MWIAKSRAVEPCLESRTPMALLQAILMLAARSSGRFINAVFGWAVRALFGFVSGTEKVWLTGVVALAAVWPVLVLGVIFPRVAAFVVAFVPIPESFPAWPLRVLWLSLAIGAPTLLGMVLAGRSRGQASRAPVWLRIARGYPTTLGLALAFWISFFTVPIQRIISALQRRASHYVPLITTGPGYDEAAVQIERVLCEHGFDVHRAAPGFFTSLPTRILSALAGASLEAHVPHHVAYLRGPELEATLYPAGLVLHGSDEQTAFAHALVVEALAKADAFQTTAPDAQRLEQKLRAVWLAAENVASKSELQALAQRLDAVAEEIAKLQAPYDDWETVYRQALQVGRALEGKPQLLGRARTCTSR
jgi:hypothetical protein